MTVDPTEVDRLTETIIGRAIDVHRTLGPGLLESVYRECLMIEFEEISLQFQTEARIPVEYKGRRLRTRLKIDLLVEKTVVLELKAVEGTHPHHMAQVLTYLKLTGCPAGLLMNFNETTLRAGLKRLYHPDYYRGKRVASGA